MTKFRLLLVLLLAETLVAEEDPEPIFRAARGELEMGYCFGVDYITLYKLTKTERQLLGNSSNPVFEPPEAYRDRVTPTSQTDELLGMQVEDLRLSDSGIYLRECWKDDQLVKHHKYYLYVCDEEVKSREILVGSDGGADLVCNFSGQKNATIRWFTEANAGYKISLFLDTKKSLEPLQEELKGVLQVLDKGFSLHLSANGLKNNRNFFCLVMEGEQCKAFQNIHMPEYEMPVFHGVGERVVLPCSSDPSSERYWETPFGNITETTPSKNKGSIASEMYISKSKEADDYSLVIPSITLNHSGEYSCSMAEYSISVCAELKTNTIQLNAGDKVTLDCNSAMEESTNIQWYQKTALLEDLLIYDSGDIHSSLYILPNFHFSEHYLTITELSTNYSGTYWCVVLLDEFTDYAEDIPEGEDENDDYDWMDENSEENSDKCIFKKVTHLNVLSRKHPRITTHSTPEPDSESGTLQYAVIGGVVVLVLVLLTVVTVVVLRAKRKARNQSVI